jgi:2-polyprenyl-6-methoxyphenol hydroxylase-like FAD-dependent oxidoreductase
MRIVIVGAGIGGLCLAIGLARIDVDIEVLEQAPEFKEVGAGLILWANGVAALERLSLAEAVAKIGQAGIGAAIRDAAGRELSGFNPDRLRDKLGYSNLSVHRADFHEMLMAVLEQRRPGVIRKDAECTKVEIGTSGCVAHLVSADGHESQVRADMLVGCDGLRSTVRSAVLGYRPPRFAGYAAWRGVTQSGAVPGEMKGGESWGCGQRFGFVPLTEGRIYWYATANISSPDLPEEDDWRPQLLERFTGWHTPVEMLIENTLSADIHFDAIFYRHPVRRWSKGTATLLGDAIHPMTPDLGQGACQAIEDAVALAGSIARDVSAGSAPAKPALSRYERARWKRAAATVLASRLVGRVGQLRAPFACRVRNKIMTLTPSSLRQGALMRLVAIRKLS